MIYEETTIQTKPVGAETYYVRVRRWVNRCMKSTLNLRVQRPWFHAYMHLCTSRTGHVVLDHWFGKHCLSTLFLISFGLAGTKVPGSNNQLFRIKHIMWLYVWGMMNKCIGRVPKDVIIFVNAYTFLYSFLYGSDTCALYGVLLECCYRVRNLTIGDRLGDYFSLLDGISKSLLYFQEQTF